MFTKIYSLILLIVLSPLLIIVALAIVLDSSFPIFYRQKRIGRNNNHFWIYKFRTMKLDTPDIPTHLVKNSTSFNTSIGSFLRKFSIDELPQLINILKGEMIFIGPRPALHNQDDLIKLRTQAGIHVLMPGLTGWAQVNGRDNLNITEKVKMDEYYLKNQSLFLNLKILYMTVIKVVKNEGVSN